ncbi:MAG: RdgB/HAM1 family non-canonical purine NTP pyrophosphatase [Legionellales bacterium]|nr:RdgB/HAM1 family non-canonical purine NTP pyrophosphatase [Legionellales bacterium]
MYQKIILASSNKGKIAEFQAILPTHQLIPQSDLDIPDADETGLTFIENALIKARNACKLSGLPSIADDSGLIVDALDGRPGIYSARYGSQDSNHTTNIEKVLSEMRDVLAPQRTARFVCTVVFMRNDDDPLPIVCQGLWEGTLLNKPQGEYGFGYDPIFWVSEYNCSAAELEPQLKNTMSHRAKALACLADAFRKIDRES